MAEQVGERTRLVFVCNPNNPTGTTAVDRDARRAVPLTSARRLPRRARRGLPRVRDRPRLSRRRRGARASTRTWPCFRTFSKAYGLAALRVGYAIARPEVIGELRKVRVPFAVNALAQAAALASLAAHDEMRGRVDGVISERRRLLAAMRGLGLPVVPSEANFVWLAGARARRRARRVQRASRRGAAAVSRCRRAHHGGDSRGERPPRRGAARRDRRTRGRFECRLVGDEAYGASATQRLTSSPIPSIAVRTTWPGARKTGGSMAAPTPPGVPVRTRSPGRSVTTLLT